jgi:hypothetical protein
MQYEQPIMIRALAFLFELSSSTLFDHSMASSNWQKEKQKE